MALISKKRIQGHIVETIIGVLMIVFAAIAIYIMVSALQLDEVTPTIPIFAVLIVIILALLAQTVIMIKIYEMGLQK